MPRLTAPTIDLHEAFLAAHREWGDGLHEDGFGITADDDVISPNGFAAWIARVHEGPAASWWIVDDEPGARTITDADDTPNRVGGAKDEPTILGAIALRPTEFSGDRVTGHIGYGVTPSARGRGIATWALHAALSEATERGMPSCVLVCLDDNIASVRTIERCGGHLEQTVTDDEGVRRRIYRIALPASTLSAALRDDEPGREAP